MRFRAVDNYYYQKVPDLLRKRKNSYEQPSREGGQKQIRAKSGDEQKSHGRGDEDADEFAKGDVRKIFIGHTPLEKITFLE